MQYADRLKQYLHERADWQPQTIADGYGRMGHGAAQGIAVHRQSAHKLLHTDGGEAVVATQCMWCLERVGVGDLLDGQRVLLVRRLSDGRGVVAGYEVYV